MELIKNSNDRKYELTQRDIERMESRRKMIIEYDKKFQAAIQKLTNEGIPTEYTTKYIEDHKKLNKTVPDIFAKGHTADTSSSRAKRVQDSSYLSQVERVATEMENSLKALDKLPLQYQLDQIEHESLRQLTEAHEEAQRKDDTIARLERNKGLLEGAFEVTNGEIIKRGQEFEDLTDDNAQLRRQIEQIQEQLEKSTLEKQQLHNENVEQAKNLQAAHENNAFLKERLRILALLRTSPEKPALKPPKDPNATIQSKKKEVKFTETTSGDGEGMDNYRENLTNLQRKRKSVKYDIKYDSESEASIKNKIKEARSEIVRSHDNEYYNDKEEREDTRIQKLDNILQTAQNNPDQLADTIKEIYEPLKTSLEQMRGSFNEEELREINDTVDNNRASVIETFRPHISQEDVLRQIDEIDKMYEEVDTIQYKLVLTTIEHALSTDAGIISLNSQLSATEMKIEALKKQRSEIEEQLKNERQAYYNRPEHLTNPPKSTSFTPESSDTDETDEEDASTPETSTSGKEDPKQVLEALKSGHRDEEE